ncbi:hypothetical protein K3495_g4636 [Podosphaera aphanis]|nr:hypothetical protein K3495_g4636 [Podosphaera aphanis]
MSTNSCPSSIAEVAADRLWQFQLRKENKTILDRLETNEQMKEMLHQKTEKKLQEGEEKLKRLEARISELERECLSKKQAFENFKLEQKSQIAEIKQQIKQFLESRNSMTEGEIKKIMERLTTASNHRTVLNKKSASATKDSCSRLQPVRQLHYTANHEQPQIPLSVPRLPERGIQLRLKDASVNRRPNTRGQLKSLENSLHNGPGSTGLPKLNQGTNQLKHYYEYASSTLALVSSPTEQFEIDFVNSFINGIISPKISEKLVGQLQQTHPSKQKKDGRVEILCSWFDLGEAIKKAKIFGDRSNSYSGKK